MNLNNHKYSYLLLVSLLIIAGTAISANAEDPKPESSRLQDGSIYLGKNNNSSKLIAREYTFKAPDNKTLSNSKQITAAQGYKVEVYGNAPELLVKVRNIEPKAFINGNIIQVGIFSQQNNAEDMVRKLAGAGFWSRITAQ